MNFKVNFIPLSFINSEAEILNLIRNTFLFSSLFNKYEEVTLNHYLESTQYGFTASASDNGTHKLVRITDIKDGGVEWASVPFCNCENDVKYILTDNDILIARTGGTTGKSFIVKDAPKNAVYASYLIRLRLKENVDINFITAYLNSYVFWSQIVELKAGSAMPNVNAEKLKTLRIPKCDFTTQKQLFNSNESTQEVQLKIQSIESIFGDNKLLSTELTHQLTLVKQLRQSFLREAMQGKLTADFRSEHPELIERENSAQALLEKIKAEKKQLIKDGKLKKEKELSPVSEDEIPFEINENDYFIRLGEICNIEKGKIGIQQAVDGIYPLVVTGENRLSHNEAHFFGKGIIIPLVSSTGHGHASLKRIHFEEGEFAVGNILACVTTYLPHYFNLKFIYHYLDTYKEWYFVEKMKGAANVSLKISSIQETPIPIIPIEIQNKFEELMRICDELEASIRTSQKQNKMLLQQVLREALEKPEEEKVEVLMAAQSCEVYQTSNNASQKKWTIGNRTVLTAYLIKKFNKKGFGRVMLMKLLFLIEYICELDFDSHYKVNVAGPYDDLIREIELKLRTYMLYDAQQSKIDNHVTYHEMGASDNIENLFYENFSNEAELINSTLDKFTNSNWEQCEIIATLYAVWNNRFIKGDSVNDIALKQDFLNWDPHKKKYKNRLDSALLWMRDHEVVPIGWGKTIEK